MASNGTIWPLLVSNAINKQNGILKAGPKQKNADAELAPGVPLASQYLNWLWLPEDKVREGYHVMIDTEALAQAPVSQWSLNNARQQAFLSVEGDNFSNKIIRFSVERATGMQHYDVTTNKTDRFAAVADIAQQFNAAIADVRLGEMLAGDQTTVLASQYRNKIWIKHHGSDADILVKYEVLSR